MSQSKSPDETMTADHGTPLSAATASDVVGETDEKTDPAVVPEDMSNPLTFDLPSADLVEILEAFGLINAIEGLDLQQMTDENTADMNPLAVVGFLIDRLQQHQPGLSDNRQAELAVLQQLLANVRDGQSPLLIDVSSHRGWNPYQVLTPNSEFGEGSALNSDISPKQAAALDQLNQWIRSLTPGLPNQTAASNSSMGPGASDGKMSVALPSEAGSLVWSAVNSPGASQSSNPASSEATNLSSDMRPASTGINQESVVKIDAEAESTGNAKDRELTGPAAVRPVNADADGAKRVVSAYEQSNTPANPRERQSQKPNPASDAIASDHRSQNPGPVSGRVPTIAKFTEYLAPGSNGEEPISRVFQETQLAKDGVARVDPVLFEENFSKVVKSDAGTNENGLLNSSGQNTEKLAEMAATKKEAEAGQGDLRTQTMDQIVRKAALQLRNGQHEARIELKPDFLGHIRMQVISDQQQVTVRILAEHGFVKEMLEGNMHQLKADLQQQGLEIDKLEVTVSRDSEDSANYKDRLPQSKFRQGSQNQNNEDHPQEEPSEKPRRSVLAEDKSSAVDFFA